MNTKSLVNKCLKFVDMPNGRSKHFSFIMDGNKPLSFGWNNTRKTHPRSAKFKYRFNNIHSELDAIVNYLKIYTVEDLRKYTLVNIRLLKDKSVRLSKPCHVCDRLLDAFGIVNVLYSTDRGDFVWL